MKLVLPFLFLALMVHLIKLNNPDLARNKMEKILKYVIVKPRTKINLNLFEAEKYEPAIIVQQLIGNLVYESNFGRYEPRLAESWEKIDDFTWSFKLKPNLKCENGEIISPKAFKESLERSILIFEKKGGVPILSSLKGFKKFIQSNEGAKSIYDIQPLQGISFEKDQLTFTFDKKIRSGLLQILSFSPFGYICNGNFTSKGEWADDSKFISSGPYKIEKYEYGVQYHLIKNSHWNDFLVNAPDRVIFSHDDGHINPDTAIIIDAFTNEYQNDKLLPYHLVPQYLNSVLLGNLDHGYFKNTETRVEFKRVFNLEVDDKIPSNFGVNTRSSSFYPNQEKISKTQSNQYPIKMAIPKEPLLIEGDIPIQGTSRWYAWVVLKSTLERLKFPYKFAKNESTFERITDRSYDLRIRGSSIGGGVEAWGLYVCFCSSMGINFPDPKNLVCDLISKYENDELSEVEFGREFIKSVSSESAILPVSHYGVQLFISESIELARFSPVLSIFKFDQMEIK